MTDDANRVWDPFNDVNFCNHVPSANMKGEGFMYSTASIFTWVSSHISTFPSAARRFYAKRGKKSD